MARNRARKAGPGVTRSVCGAAVLLALCASRLIAQTTGPGAEEQPSNIIPGEVIAVRFVGNHALSSEELATVTQTKAPGFLSNLAYHALLHVVGTPYESLEIPKLERDTAALKQYYADHGFIDAQATFRITYNHNDLRAYFDYIRHQMLVKGGVNEGETLPTVRDTVTFYITEGEPYTISRIAVEGLESLPIDLQPQVTEHVAIHTGERWSRVAAAKEVQRLINILVESGYPNARSDSLIVNHTSGYHTVDLLLFFRSGHRYRYGPVHIIFDSTAPTRSRIAENVILAQLTTIEGHWYHLSDVQRSEANLSKLGTFDLFRISLDTTYLARIPDSLRDSADVPILVYLRMRRIVDFPINVFIGTSIQGFVFGFGAGFIDKNLTGAADNLNLQGADQPLPSSQQRYSLSLDYTRPYIGLGRIPLIAGLGFSLQSQQPVFGLQQYSEHSYTAHAGSNIVLSTTDNKTTLAPDILIADINVAGDSAVLALLPKKQINLLPSVNYQDDRTNDPINPTSGDLLSLGFEVGVPSKFLLGDSSSDYAKFVPQIKYYYDFTDHGGAVLQTRVRIGYSYLFYDAVRSHDPSLDHRFYGGGGASVRGWADQGLVVSQDTNYTANLGGFYDLDANLEFQFQPFYYTQEFTTWQKFSSPLRIALFYDAGNVWDQIVQVAPHEISVSQIAQTLGLGIRYNTFFGALRVDCGFKLYDPSGRFNNDFHAITPAMRGGWLYSLPMRQWFHSGYTFNWHFGIGQAF